MFNYLYQKNNSELDLIKPFMFNLYNGKDFCNNLNLSYLNIVENREKQAKIILEETIKDKLRNSNDVVKNKIIEIFKILNTNKNNDLNNKKINSIINNGK